MGTHKGTTMRALFYDTETTGLPLWKEPSEDPRQPHIVQLAAILVDLDSWQRLAGFDLTIAPDGWEIPADVVAVHGITTEHAKAVGVHEEDAVDILWQLWRRAEVRVGHNEAFDARIVRCAMMRAGTFGPNDHDIWKAGLAECTQLMATPILKLPPTDKMRASGFNKPKTANLREAYLHFMGAELDGAHSAMGDVLGCLAVYRAIKTIQGCAR